MSSHPSPLRNVLWNWAAFIFNVAITFVLSPFVVRKLGSSDYGIWVLLGSLVGYLGLLDFGVRGAVTRYVARMHTAASHEQASKLVSTALAIFSAMGLVAVLISTFFAAAIVHRFNITPTETQTARVVIVLIGMAVGVTLVGGAYGGVVIGLQRFDIEGAIEVSLGAGRAVAVYLILTFGYGLVALAVVQLAVSILRTLTSYILARRLYPQLILRIGTWDHAAFKQIFSFSFYSTLLLFSSSLVFYSDSVVIGAMLPMAAVTYFTIAGNLVDYSRSVIRGISTTLTPRTSALEVEGGHAAVNGVILRSSRMATLLLAPIAITFLLRGAHFIGLWMGLEYDDPAGVVLRILTYSLILMGSGSVMMAALMGVSLHKGIVPFNIAEAAVNLALSIFLARRIGLPGVAWGTTLPSLVMSLVVLPWYAHRTLGLPILGYYRNAWIRPFVALIPFAAATALVAEYWPGGNLITYFLGVGAVLPLAAVGAWLIAFDPVDRDVARQAIRRGVGFLRKAQPA